MTRIELEHIIRAAAGISADEEIVIIGSQAILGQFPNAPESLRRSMEADVFPRNFSERWDLIDGSIGEGSVFHETFGYYAQGVEARTAVLPSGWQARLIRICNENTRGATGWTLEVHDLVVAKYVAGRDKDVVFNREIAGHKMASGAILLERLVDTQVEAAVRALVEARIRADFGVG